LKGKTGGRKGFFPLRREDFGEEGILPNFGNRVLRWERLFGVRRFFGRELGRNFS